MQITFDVPTRTETEKKYLPAGWVIGKFQKKQHIKKGEYFYLIPEKGK